MTVPTTTPTSTPIVTPISIPTPDVPYCEVLEELVETVPERLNQIGTQLEDALNSLYFPAPRGSIYYPDDLWLIDSEWGRRAANQYNMVFDEGIDLWAMSVAILEMIESGDIETGEGLSIRERAELSRDVVPIDGALQLRLRIEDVEREVAIAREELEETLGTDLGVWGRPLRNAETTWPSARRLVQNYIERLQEIEDCVVFG